MPLESNRPETLYSAILLKADVPDKNGNIYSSKVLKDMAKKNTKELSFKHGCLYRVHKSRGKI